MESNLMLIALRIESLKWRFLACDVYETLAIEL
jgi:hypothetical protein